MPELRNHIASLQDTPTATAIADPGPPRHAPPSVIVCAMRPRSELLGACLRALSDDGAEPLLAVGAEDPQRASAEGVAEALGVRTVPAKGSGIAALHNAALAICASPTLALIDDDVVVERGWFSALGDAWAHAPDDIAVIGGPLRLRLLGAAPRWWRREAEEAFAAHDYGAQAMVLDPRRQTMHAGNISFRCDALRGAEGFWPARGRGQTRDWCSDEHSAQHALGALGWRSLYEPRAIAHRLIDSEAIGYGEVLARRFRSAGRAAVTDGRAARADALGRAFRSAATLAAAPVRVGRDRRLMESSAELAASAGALVGPLLAARDFQPTEQTPFRPFVPGLVRSGRRDRTRRFSRTPKRGGPAILVYHRVHPEASPGSERVSPAHFEEHLTALRSRTEIVDVATIVQWARSGSRAPDASNMVAITFDDGYVDNLTHAAPLLDAHSAPATVFVATGHIESQEPFFWDEVEQLLSAAEQGDEPLLSLEVAGHRRSWLTRTAQERRSACAIVKRLLQALTPLQRAGALEQLRAFSAAPAPRAWCEARGRPMTVAELRSLAAMPLIDIAAHTVTHTSLRFQSVETQRRELIEAREQLDKWLGASTARGFAYPFGISGADFDEVTAALVCEHGYAYAVSNDRGTIARGGDTFALPRLAVPDVDGPAFARWLDDVR